MSGCWGSLSLSLRAGEREGALSSAGSSPALRGPGQAPFPAGILAASRSHRHFTRRAGCAPELPILPDTSRARTVLNLPGGGGSSFVSLRVTHKVMALWLWPGNSISMPVTLIPFSFPACVPPNPALPLLQPQRDEL